MKVAELIKELEKYDGDMQVAYEKYSEYCELEDGDLIVKRLCKARSDGWIECDRPDRELVDYLVFPGN